MVVVLTFKLLKVKKFYKLKVLIIIAYMDILLAIVKVFSIPKVTMMMTRERAIFRVLVVSLTIMKKVKQAEKVHNIHQLLLV